MLILTTFQITIKNIRLPKKDTLQILAANGEQNDDKDNFTLRVYDMYVVHYIAYLLTSVFLMARPQRF